MNKLCASYEVIPRSPVHTSRAVFSAVGFCCGGFPSGFAVVLRVELVGGKVLGVGLVGSKILVVGGSSNPGGLFLRLRAVVHCVASPRECFLHFTSLRGQVKGLVRLPVPKNSPFVVKPCGGISSLSLSRFLFLASSTRIPPSQQKTVSHTLCARWHPCLRERST